MPHESEEPGTAAQFKKAEQTCSKVSLKNFHKIPKENIELKKKPKKNQFKMGLSKLAQKCFPLNIPLSFKRRY